MADVLCLGNIVVDVIAKPLDRLPPPGQLLLLDALETHVGGNGPNCALALARLGERAAVCGRVGEDLYGRYLLSELARAEVETGPVVRDGEQPTGVTLVAVDRSGERSFLYHPGANAAFRTGDVAFRDLEGLRWLHAGSFFVLPALEGGELAHLLRSARARGVRTTLDVCWDESGAWMERLAPCLPEVDFFLPSEGEAAALSGTDSIPEMARRFHAAGARGVIIKCAARGCFASVDSEQGWEPAFQVPLVDATGAGDCFIAGFLCGQLQGWPLGRCLRLANACGALAVSGVGATRGMLPRAEVEAWMARHAQYPAEGGC
jgi:sugar/nucleoside kinase (ribokinase family)